MRRAALALASAAALSLAACGSGTIESRLQPSRVAAFGDGLTDMGQVAGRKYTVNDATVNNWAFFIAANFTLPLSPAAAGGAAYATGNARIVNKPDAAGNAATPTVKEQIDTFLAANVVSENDLLLVNGGISDIVAQMALVTAGTQTPDQMLVNVGQAGRDLAVQVKRLVAAGSTHVVVSGTYDLARSPWATATGQSALLSQASTKFNEELLVALVNEGNNVLYVDAALLFNLMTSNPAAYAFTNVIVPVCASVDPGPGIGTGTAQLNSALCTPTTVANANYDQFLFADRIYPTPEGHRKFGDYAYSRIRNRW
jgi:phospholipase/lecithinase/hemolysin